MAAYRLTWALLLFTLARQCDCRQPTVTITPQTLSLQPNQSDTGGTVTVTCQASGLEDEDDLFVMNIMRTEGNREILLVAATSTSTEAVLQAGTGLIGASVSGGITPGALTSTMTLTMTQATCDDDEGRYTCTFTVLGNPPVAQTLSDHKNLSIEVIPGPVLLTPSPRGTTSWTVGETLTMTCNAPVGTVDDDTEIEWVWQWRNPQIVLSTLWSVYDGNDTDIEDGTMVPMQCYQRRVSILTRKLTMDDNNREYRCYIRRRQGQAAFENFDQYAGVHAVGSVSEDNSGGDNTGGSSGSTDTSKANTGGIIGGVIGGLVALIVIIVIIVYFVVIRPKRNKPTQYGTGVDPNKPAPYTVDPDPAPVYSQPHRNRFARDRENRGVSNRAMEDEGEKPRSYESKPARYENDFHQGRPNQAYDYDGDSRGRRYSTDDGTDNRMNTSMHSQGTGDPTIGTAI